MVDNLKYTAKAWIAGLAVAVVAAVGQAGEASDINELGGDSWLKALGAAAITAIGVYLTRNGPKPVDNR